LENRIEKIFQNYFRNKKVVIAFSGNLNSTVLYELVSKSAKKVIPVIIKSRLQPVSEIKDAIKYLTKKKKKYKIIGFDPLDYQEIIKNDPKRCYYCKKAIFKSIIEEIKNEQPDFIIEDSSFSDLDAFNSSIEALREMGIKSPFIELKITKDQILALAQEMKLDIVDNPSYTCLATRIPYGKKINVEVLNKVEEAEKIIKKIFPVKILRVRDHGDIARIEVTKEDLHFFLDSSDISDRIEELKELGFKYITLDLEAYRQGSLNVPLPEKIPIPSDN
jgi:uncharacterized protein